MLQYNSTLNEKYDRLDSTLDIFIYNAELVQYMDIVKTNKTNNK